MDYSQLDLDLIKLFGKKELSEGCLVGNFYNGNSFGYKVLSYEKFDCVINGDSEFIRVVSFHRKKEMYEYDSRDSDSKKAIDYLKSQILGHLPTFEDIYIRAKEKGYKIKTKYINLGDYILHIYGIIGKYLEEYEILWNPFLSPLEQSEETKQQLINLFK